MKNPLITTLAGTAVAMVLALLWVPLHLDPAVARQMDRDFARSSLPVKPAISSADAWEYGPIWNADGSIVVWWEPVAATEALILLLGGGLLTLVVRRKRQRKTAA